MAGPKFVNLNICKYPKMYNKYCFTFVIFKTPIKDNLRCLASAVLSNGTNYTIFSLTNKIVTKKQVGEGRNQTHEHDAIKTLLYNHAERYLEI